MDDATSGTVYESASLNKSCDSQTRVHSIDINLTGKCCCIEKCWYELVGSSGTFRLGRNGAAAKSIHA